MSEENVTQPLVNSTTQEEQVTQETTEQVEQQTTPSEEASQQESTTDVEVVEEKSTLQSEQVSTVEENAQAVSNENVEANQPQEIGTSIEHEQVPIQTTETEVSPSADLNAETVESKLESKQVEEEKKSGSEIASEEQQPAEKETVNEPTEVEQVAEVQESNAPPKQDSVEPQAQQTETVNSEEVLQQVQNEQVAENTQQEAVEIQPEQPVEVIGTNEIQQSQNEQQAEVVVANEVQISNDDQKATTEDAETKDDEEKIRTESIIVNTVTQPIQEQPQAEQQQPSEQTETVEVQKSSDPQQESSETQQISTNEPQVLVKEQTVTTDIPQQAPVQQEVQSQSTSQQPQEQQEMTINQCLANENQPAVQQQQDSSLQPQSEPQETVETAQSDIPANLPFKILHKGNLFKQGSRMQSWKKRFHYFRYYEKEQCVVLAYHAAEKDIAKKPLGAIDMWQVYDIEEVQSAKPHAIQISSLEGRKFIMAAESEEEKSMWLEELKRTRKLAKNQTPTNYLACDNLSNTVYDTISSIFGTQKKPDVISEEIRGRVDCLRKLQELNDCVWDFECDVKQLQQHPQVPQSYKDKFGENMATYYLRPLAHKISAYCDDLLVKEEFVDVCSASVLIFEFNTDVKRYSELDVREGALVLKMLPDRFMTNTQEVGNDLLAVLSKYSRVKLPIIVRQNLRATIPTRDEALKRIENATGRVFTFEANFEELYHTPEVPESYKDNMPGLVFGNYLNTLSTQIEHFCKDSMKQEALLELTGAGRIVFEFGPTERYCSIVASPEGILYIRVPANRFCTNVHEVGNDLLTTFNISPTHKITLTERLAIRDSQALLTELTDKILNAYGQKLEFIVDYEQICNTEGISSPYNVRMAEKIVKGYFGNFTDKLISFCNKVESFKSQMSSAVPTNQVVFSFASETKSYIETVVKNGQLVIQCTPRNFYTNVHQCGSDLDKVIAGSL